MNQEFSSVCRENKAEIRIFYVTQQLFYQMKSESEAEAVRRSFLHFDHVDAADSTRETGVLLIHPLNVYFKALHCNVHFNVGNVISCRYIKVILYVL